jgi:hypothetical protein
MEGSGLGPTLGTVLYFPGGTEKTKENLRRVGLEAEI